MFLILTGRGTETICDCFKLCRKICSQIVSVTNPGTRLALQKSHFKQTKQNMQITFYKNAGISLDFLLSAKLSYSVKMLVGWLIHWLVDWFVEIFCGHDNSKSSERILMKFSGKVRNGPRKN